MAGPEDRSAELREAVREAAAAGRALELRGGGTKAFLGRSPRGEVLALADHRGVVNHQPTELVVTARAGTSLAELEETLGEAGQMLAFEPPRFGEGATLGGCVAAGISGPRRAYAGAVRDFVLGTRVLNGRGEILRFGGEVMKNVAGYDCSRLMVGAMGTLGVLLEVSVKVLPKPPLEQTRVLELDAAAALELMNRLAGQPLPVSATAPHGGRLMVRLSGTANGVAAGAARIGGEPLADDAAWWRGVREQEHAFFTTPGALWRLAMPQHAPQPELAGEWFLEWGGAQRWLRTTEPAERVRGAAAAGGGHAAVFRGGEREGAVFHPLSPGLLKMHRALKRAFDPAGLFNPGRLYQEL